MESSSSLRFLPNDSYIQDVRHQASFNYKLGVAGLVFSVVLIVVAVSAVIFAAYALAHGGVGTFALYHSVKILVIGSVAAGLGAILTVRMAKKNSQAREEMRANEDDGLMRKKAESELQLLQSQLREATIICWADSGSLTDLTYRRGEGEVNSVGRALLEDIEKSSDKSKERGLLGVVLVIVALVMFTMVISALATGVTTGNAMIGVWLISSIAVVGIGSALVYSGFNHLLHRRSRSEAAKDLSDSDALESHLRALGKHPSQLQAKIDAIVPGDPALEES